jgi:hypothetical protein
VHPDPRSDLSRNLETMTEFITALRAAGVTHSDPFVGAIAGALSVPLRQVYALLWRAGLLDITD